MSVDRLAQIFVMQHERNLNRTKGNDDAAHDDSFQRQIIEHAGNVHKVGEHQRQSHNQNAHQQNNACPFHDVAKPAHGKAEKSSFFKAESFDPGEANGDQINLDVDTKKIFEDEGDG